jgi:deazaflavin-dependent oxidoreductase (nitroreductase family)
MEVSPASRGSEPSFKKTSKGTRGARTPSANGRLARLMERQMKKRIRRKGGKFMGMDVLFLNTVGARTGKPRETPVAWFPDGDRTWLIVASAAGSARNPGWYHNLAAHPDQVQIEIGARTVRVVPEQLEENRRDEAWQRIITAQPRYAKYQAKTDRVLPVIRLTAATSTIGGRSD